VSQAPRVSVLIVDSSVVMCHIVAQHLEATDDLRVVGVARNRDAALEMVRALHPDVVTVDALMPNGEGIATIASIMAEHAMPVVVVSEAGEDRMNTAIRGLALGAVEFVAKPESGVRGEQARLGGELVAAVRRAAGSPMQAGRGADEGGPAGRTDGRQKNSRTPGVVAHGASDAAWPPAAARQLIVIGASTGGPSALRAVIPHFSRSLPAAVIIIQHMPHTFTRSLAQRLDGEGQIAVREAQEGDLLVPGVAFMAPGDYHLTVSPEARVHLHKGQPVHGVRPSLDVTLESAAPRYARRILAVVLTGMGSDGARGAAAVKACGGTVIAEHPSTCVVFGMPRAVIEQQCTDQIVPLDQIAEAATAWSNGQGRKSLRRPAIGKTPITS